MTKKLKTSLIPPAILPFVQKPPVLRGESLQEYNDIFAELVAAVEPDDILDWLWLTKFMNSIWEALRWRRYKAVLVDLQERPALETTLLKIDSQYRHTIDEALERFWSDPSEFKQHGVDALVVPATATLDIIDALESLAKMVEQAERRYDTILQQLEFRREVKAHRARCAADKILGPRSGEIRGIEAPAIGVTEQPGPDHIGSDQPVSESGSIVPAPNSGTSSDNSSSTPSSDPPR